MLMQIQSSARGTTYALQLHYCEACRRLARACCTACNLRGWVGARYASDRATVGCKRSPAWKPTFQSIDIQIWILGQQFRYVCGVLTVSYGKKLTSSCFHTLEVLDDGLKGECELDNLVMRHIRKPGRPYCLGTAARSH
jgi:hypothetical protein